MAETWKSPEKLYGLHFTPEEIREAVAGNRLLTLDLETSRVCNLKCIYCYSEAGRARENELTQEEMRRLVDEAVELGVRVITIIGGGEPMMYPHLHDLVDYIAAKGVKQNLFTNGTWITPANAQFFQSRRVSMVVKLNSLRPEVQDELAGVRGTHARILRGLALLTEAGYASDPELPLGLETIICRQNYDEIETLWRYARDRQCHPYFEVVTFQGRAKKEKLNVSKDDLRRLFDRLLEIDRADYGFTWNPHPPIAGLSCKRHFYNLLVTSNGYVHPCSGVDINVGNVRHHSLRHILETSPVIRSLRELDVRIKGPCKTCDYHGECYGCRGFAYHFSGDYLESDPTCWRAG